MSSLAPDEASIRRELERVLKSPGFARNERMSRFLQFVVDRTLEGRGAELKETVIGAEIFGRPPAYNPKQDAIVRTEAGRLRARLGEYYSTAGADDPLIIELPRGGYVATFRLAATSPIEDGTSTIESAADSPSPVDPVRRQRAWLSSAIVGGAILIGVFGWLTWRFQSPVTVAVLPFENLNHDSADDYLADGLTDELIRTLSSFDHLAVRSRTSSFALKAKPLNVREASRQLSVDYVVEGSVLRAGDTLRINAQLIRAKDDFSVWSGRFERNVANILAVQEGISWAITSSLPIQLGSARKRAEVNPEAYDLYLRGLAAGLQDSIGFYQEAIAKDPSFALAYAAMASAYAYKTSTANGDPLGDLPKMRAAAEKALELDPLLAEAFGAMGMALARDGSWVKAEQSFRRAIQLNPSRSEGYGDYSVYVLMQQGRIREALAEMRLAEKSDPLSPDVRSELAYVLISSHLYDEAAAQCEKLPEDCHCWPSPREPVRYECLGRARIGQGRLQEGREILAEGVAKGVPIGVPLRAYLAYADGLLGRRAEAQSIIEEDWRNPYHQVLGYIGIGDKNRAIEAMRKLAPWGPVRVGLALAGPELDSIRDDPGIRALRKEVGLTR
jgi:TolB-like protein